MTSKLHRASATDLEASMVERRTRCLHAATRPFSLQAIAHRRTLPRSSQVIPVFLSQSPVHCCVYIFKCVLDRCFFVSCFFSLPNLNRTSLRRFKLLGQFFGNPSHAVLELRLSLHHTLTEALLLRNWNSCFKEHLDPHRFADLYMISRALIT